MLAWAQAQNRPPREFVEFRGTWILDETSGKGHIAGLSVARTIVIATTPTEIAVTKDSAPPEIYRIDGTETGNKDLRTGATLNRGYRFTLVAEALALTYRMTRGQTTGVSATNIITDAYSVSGNTLIVERQLSVLVEPPGNLVTLENPNNNRQTIVYRRAEQAPAR